MTERKKKLIITQLSLMFLGIIIILFTYTEKEKSQEEKIISQEAQKKINAQLSNNSREEDIFFNIEYSGLDLAGNRYILKTAEAYNNRNNQEIVNLKSVEATFYFKDGTKLNVWSETGLYNNNSLDMSFYGNVKAIYENSKLYAEKAEYSNSNGYLVISDSVRVEDLKGSLFADKLLFDIKKQTLNIASFENSKINANVNLK